MKARRLSATLELRDTDICCKACGEALAKAETSWKREADVSSVPVSSLPGAASAVHPAVVLRRFSCPKCHALLDTETALPEDPFLEDVVFVRR
jgi:acetone carboxylase gamma subunit